MKRKKKNESHRNLECISGESLDKLKKEREQKDKDKKNKATTKPIAKPIWWRDKKDGGVHGDMVKKTERCKEIWDEIRKGR